MEERGHRALFTGLMLLILGLVLLALASCGGGGGATAGGGGSDCSSIAGQYRFLQHERPAFGQVTLRADGTYSMASDEQDETGTRVVHVDSEGFWEFHRGSCFVVRAWLRGQDPRIYYIIVLDAQRERGFYSSFSEHPEFRMPYVESGVIVRY